MTAPRLYPDRPRTCAETRAWAVAAKAAGAHIWQIAVFTQRQPDTLYKVLQRHARAQPRPRAIRRERSVRDVDKMLRQQERVAIAGARFRCHCGGLSDRRDGHTHCRRAA